MTRKHFEAIASILNSAEPQTDLTLRIAIFKLADYFKTVNHNFEHERFYKACGLEDEQYKHLAD